MTHANTEFFTDLARMKLFNGQVSRTRLVSLYNSSYRTIKFYHIRSVATSPAKLEGLQTQPLEMDKNTDFSRWTKEALIRRLQELESQQKVAQVPVISSSTKFSEGSTSKESPVTTTHARKLHPQKRKTDKKIDSSRYTTRLVAFKLAYLGKNYAGFEFQPSSTLSTVEEELWKALTKSCLIMPENPGEVLWDNWDYSKCGRTDRGVSAFGQVIGIRVRSNRPLPKERDESLATDGIETPGTEPSAATAEQSRAAKKAAIKEAEEEKPFDDFKDEILYCKHLNRLLPPDIRILAWCPTTAADFSARHDCQERQYRYYFTQPAYSPYPHSLENPRATPKVKDGWLDIDAMGKAARKFEGSHDFRNFCKIDPSKLIKNFTRRIFECDIVEATDAHASLPYLNQPEFRPSTGGTDVVDGQNCPKVYYFHVKGSAFLWHQIRCMVSVIFAVGQGLEAPEIIDHLLDFEAQPSRPSYVLASESPLVLWDCIFPEKDDPERKDAMNWVYVGEENPLNKHGAFGIVDAMWEYWRERKMDEVLSGQLLNLIAGLADINKRLDPRAPPYAALSQRTFEGGNRERLVGKYEPMVKKSTLPLPEATYNKEAKRRGYMSADHWRAERDRKWRESHNVEEQQEE